MANKNRVGRPTFAQMDLLRGMVLTDYQKLLKAVVEAMLKGEKDIILATHYLTRFPGDFPKGVYLKQEGDKDFRRVKANKLLRWLNKHGHTNLTSEHLRVGHITFTHLEKNFD